MTSYKRRVNIRFNSPHYSVRPPESEGDPPELLSVCRELNRGMLESEESQAGRGPARQCTVTREASTD